MSAMVWLVGLVVVFGVLWLLAWLKPTRPKALSPKSLDSQSMPTPPKVLSNFGERLSALLPQYQLISKVGTTQRLIVKHQNRHFATIVLSDQQGDINQRHFDDTLIIEVGLPHSDEKLTKIAQIVHNYHQKTAQ